MQARLSAEAAILAQQAATTDAAAAAAVAAQAQATALQRALDTQAAITDDSIMRAATFKQPRRQAAIAIPLLLSRSPMDPQFFFVA